VPIDPEGTEPTALLNALLSEFQFLDQEIDLLVFPECSLTGFYPIKARELANSEGKAFTHFFSEVASELRTHVLAGSFRESPLGVTNEAVFFSPLGREISSYRKAKLFRMAREDDLLFAGKTPNRTTIGGLEVSPKICYDLRFPNCFYEQSPDVDLFAVIANWPDARKDHWQTLLRARAIENEAFVLGVNRTGVDFFGLSFSTRPVLFDPAGKDCDPFHESDLMSVWKLRDRSEYETVGSTLGKSGS
jgi:omega-amidase